MEASRPSLLEPLVRRFAGPTPARPHTSHRTSPRASALYPTQESLRLTSPHSAHHRVDFTPPSPSTTTIFPAKHLHPLHPPTRPPCHRGSHTRSAHERASASLAPPVYTSDPSFLPHPHNILLLSYPPPRTILRAPPSRPSTHNSSLQSIRFRPSTQVAAVCYLLRPASLTGFPLRGKRNQTQPSDLECSPLFNPISPRHRSTPRAPPSIGRLPFTRRKLSDRAPPSPRLSACDAHPHIHLLSPTIVGQSLNTPHAPADALASPLLSSVHPNPKLARTCPTLTLEPTRRCDSSWMPHTPSIPLTLLYHSPAIDNRPPWARRTFNGSTAYAAAVVRRTAVRCALQHRLKLLTGAS